MIKKLIFSVLLLVPFISNAQEKGLDERINDWFEPITVVWEGIVFWVVPGTGVPLVVFLLVIGAIFFTIYFNNTIHYNT